MKRRPKQLKPRWFGPAPDTKVVIANRLRLGKIEHEIRKQQKVQRWREQRTEWLSEKILRRMQGVTEDLVWIRGAPARKTVGTAKVERMIALAEGRRTA